MPFAASAAEIARSDRPFARSLLARFIATCCSRNLDQVAVIAHSPAERDDATEVAMPSALIGLHVKDAFADAISLGFGNRRQDGEDQLRDTVAGYVTAEVDHV